MCTKRETQPAWVLPTAAVAALAGLFFVVLSVPLAVAAASLALAGLFADMLNTVGGGETGD